MAKDLVAVGNTSLTRAQYGDLADVPHGLEWLANITNPTTCRAYKIDLSEFSASAGLGGPADRDPSPRIAWCKDLEARELSPASTRRKLSALSSLFDHLRERNAVSAGRHRMAICWSGMGRGCDWRFDNTT